MGLWRKGSTRRVTAQRKFAQGAYVPPAMAATPSTSGVAPVVRREAPAAAHENNTTPVIRNSMSARALLDVVCFKSSHVHLEPIVLVERLREENNESVVNDNNTIQKVRKEVNVRSKKWKMAKSRPHVMKLRSQNLQKLINGSNLTTPVVLPKSLTQQQPKRSISQPKRVISQPKRVVSQPKRVMSQPKRVISQPKRVISQPKRVISQPKRVISKAKLPKKTTNVPKKVQSSSAIKRKISRRFTRDASIISEFSIGDNIPLKYFAKSSTSKVAQVNTLMGPPTKLPPKFRLTNKERFSNTASRVPICENSASKEGPGPAVDTSHVSERIEPALSVASQSVDLTTGRELPPSSMICNVSATSERAYYSKESILQWMEDSRPKLSQSKPGQSRPPETNPDCPAFPWNTLKDVLDATKLSFDTRCKICKQCEYIEKLMKITTLLKRQRKIDCYADKVKRHLVEASTSTSAVDTIKFIIMDLLPRHPHLMIKIKVQTKLNGNITVDSCLIPRLDRLVRNDFVFAENEEILEQVIINLRLCCEDQPPASEVDGYSLAGCSNYVSESTEFVKPGQGIEEDNGEIKYAPVLYPSTEEFADPISYINKIWDRVSISGICKICPPPGFFPTCKADDDICFGVSNQYISRLYSRWSPATKVMCAIKASVQAQGVDCGRPLKLEGVEINLPRLYNAVQRFGGLQEVFNGKKWDKVSDDLNLNTNPFTIRKLERLYIKYILPYDALSVEERRDLMQKAETTWLKKHKMLLKYANNPLHHQKRLLGESDSSSDDSDGREEPHDAEDCVTIGNNMNLAEFKKIASTTFDNHFRNRAVNTKEIEKEYWNIVLGGMDHVCVNSASIDTADLGLGFTQNKDDEYSKHPWNLKRLSDNPNNVLRSLGPGIGVTVPTLHLGMVFSTSCWHRDPHSIPWMEYLHQGPVKIWYSVPENQDTSFRRVTEMLHPTACQNKSLWLPSDISMVPPTVLRENNVQVYRLEQKPGEFVLVMPRAYSSSICTGYSVSESTYFATDCWLNSFTEVFKEIRNSCEPTTFAIEQLLKSIAEDPRTSIHVLKKIGPALKKLFIQEIGKRELLVAKGLKVTIEAAVTKPGSRSKRKRAFSPPQLWNVRDLDECELCRCTLYLSKVQNIPCYNSMVCLEHALELLGKKKYEHIRVSDLELIFIFTTEELHETMNIVSARLN